MRKPIFLIALIAITHIAGCVRSFNPLFSDKESILDTSLIGVWISDDGKTTYEIQASEGKSYALIHHFTNFQGNESTTKFKARLGDLAGERFLDTSPEPGGLMKMDDPFDAAHYIPAHIFTRIRKSGTLLLVARLNNDWLKKMIETGKISISHQVEGGGVLLNASTTELQAFLQRYAASAEAFPTEDQFHRHQ